MLTDKDRGNTIARSYTQGENEKTLPKLKAKAKAKEICLTVSCKTLFVNRATTKRWWDFLPKTTRRQNGTYIVH